MARGTRGGKREDRWNGYEKYKSISVLIRAARDGSHARRYGTGRQKKKKRMTLETEKGLVSDQSVSTVSPLAERV